jgi:hypothetical protein
MNLQPSSYYFSYYDPQFDRIFHSRMLSSQCQFIKKNGERCKKKCCIGIEYCRPHLTQKKNLQIRKSTIPNGGLGLFAYKEYTADNTIIFKKGDKICEYEGELLTAEQINERYHGLTAPYSVALNQNQFVDSSLERGIGSLSNTKPNHNNASFVIDNRNHKASIKATVNIKQNQEIFLSYGRSYKMPNEENVHYYTRGYNTKY